MPVSRTIPTSQTPDLVTYTILIDGEEVPLSVPIKSILVNKEINKIPFGKIVIQDGDVSVEDFALSNSDQFIPGKEIEIKLGYHGDNLTVFKGIITSHSNNISSTGLSSLQIEFKDKAVKLTIGRRNKQYNDVADNDVAEEILSRYGLDKEVEMTAVIHENLVQFDITDWDFLLMRMDLLGLVCIVDDNKVTFKRPDFSSASVLDVLYGSTILDYEATIDARNQWQTVTAHAWNYSQQSVSEETANEPRIVQEAGDLSASVLNDVIGLDDYKLIHSGKLSTVELISWADARLQKQRLAKIQGKVKIIGYPQLKPDTYITLNGVGNRFNGPVYVSGVRHEFNAGVWETHVNFGMSTEWFAESLPYRSSNSNLGMLPTLNGLVIGIVTDLEDPEGEHRVRVKIPVLSSEGDGNWARIASLDAGGERGMFFRPEIGDEVIIGSINNDASQLVILGMLNSSQLAAPLTAANANDEKGYVSRSNMKWIFNDNEKSLKIETPAGKKIFISEQDNIISMEDENNNKIIMDISGITIETSGALNLKGGSTAIMEAPSITIDGSGITNIKGGIVNIN